MSSYQDKENEKKQHETLNQQKQQSNEKKSSLKQSKIQENKTQQLPQQNVSMVQDNLFSKSLQLNTAQILIKAELESMQFEQQLILQSLNKTQSLDQAIEYIISKIEQNQKKQTIQQQLNEVKLFFIVRMDLKMGTGKIAAQVGHAALHAFQNMKQSSSINYKLAKLFIQWMQKGQKNKILQAQTEQEIFHYLKQAENKLIKNCFIRDAGRTQIAAGSMTVAAIGPVRQCEVDFLKHLKQL